MDPKPSTRTSSSRGRPRRGGGVSISHDGIANILVEDLLSVEEYDRYMKSYHSLRFTASQFFCNIDDLDGFGFGFKELLVFQNLGRFLELKNAYGSSQVKAFYCIAERIGNGVSFMCQFKNHDVSLSPSSWTNLTRLVCA